VLRAAARVLSRHATPGGRVSARPDVRKHIPPPREEVSLRTPGHTPPSFFLIHEGFLRQSRTARTRMTLASTR
jgi:hypothetical protein